MCLTVGRQSRDHRPLSRDPSVSFYKKFPNSLKRPKTLFDSQPTVVVTSDHCRVTVQRLFSKKFLIAWNVQKNVVWQSGRRSRDLRPLSRDRSATFFKIVFYCLKRPKNVIWQSVDGRVTSTVVAWPFSDFFKNFANCLKRPKALFDSRPTVAWPPTTVAWPFSDFFQKKF